MRREQRELLSSGTCFRGYEDWFFRGHRPRKNGLEYSYRCLVLLLFEGEKSHPGYSRTRVSYKILAGKSYRHFTIMLLPFSIWKDRKTNVLFPRYARMTTAVGGKFIAASKSFAGRFIESLLVLLKFGTRATRSRMGLLVDSAKLSFPHLIRR